MAETLSLLSVTSLSGGGGGGGNTPILVGVVTNGDHLPATRPDGTALVLGDYVRANSTATFPLTIDGLTFSSVKDSAVWVGSEWQMNVTAFQYTSETPLKVKADESLSGNANYQSEVNIEVKQKFTDVLSLINTLNDEYKKAGFTFNATTTDTNGVRKIVLDVYNKNGDILLNKTLANFVLSERTIAGYDLSDDITAQEIQDAIKDLPAELTNKTIDCGTFF